MRSSLACLLILITLSSAACHTMRPVALDQLSTESPSRVWVTKADQSVVVLSGPQILENRLAGFVDDVFQVIPAEDVRRIVMRRPAGARTAALVAGVAAGATFLLVGLAGTGDYLHPCTRDTAKCDPGEVP